MIAPPGFASTSIIITWLQYYKYHTQWNDRQPVLSSTPAVSDDAIEVA